MDVSMDFVKSLAEEAGAMALERFEALSSEDLHFKSAKDIVTEVDKELERLIVGRIHDRFPGHGTYGEEYGKSDENAEWLWIVDPIDGTTSFVHGQPFYSVSIGVRRKGVPTLAAVCAPKLGETFCAERGAGAFVGGKRMKVSKRDKLVNSVLATGFACLRAGKEPNNLPAFCRIAPKLRDVRRCGSAAIDMAFVAAGRLEGYWERDLKLYDIAAGELLVSEAGGHVMDFKRGADYPNSGTIATNGLVDEELLPLLDDARWS
jgi:myo-inositol-1(or 4)-monophosphatase